MKMEKNLQNILKKEEVEIVNLEENLLSPEKQIKFNNWLKDQIFQMKSKFESSIELKSYQNTLSIIQEEINESQFSKFESLNNTNYDLKNSVNIKRELFESKSEDGTDLKLKNFKLIDEISIREIQEKYLNKKKLSKKCQKDLIEGYENNFVSKKHGKLEFRIGEFKKRDNLKDYKKIFENKNLLKKKFENSENIRNENNYNNYVNDYEKDEKIIFPKDLESRKFIKKIDKRKNLILKEKFDFKSNKLKVKKKEKIYIKNNLKKSLSSDLLKEKILKTSFSFDKKIKKTILLKEKKKSLFNSFTKKHSLKNIFKKKNFSFIVFNKKIFQSKRGNSNIKNNFSTERKNLSKTHFFSKIKKQKTNEINFSKKHKKHIKISFLTKEMNLISKKNKKNDEKKNTLFLIKLEKLKKKIKNKKVSFIKFVDILTYLNFFSKEFSLKYLKEKKNENVLQKNFFKNKITLNNTLTSLLENDNEIIFGKLKKLFILLKNKNLVLNIEKVFCLINFIINEKCKNCDCSHLKKKEILNLVNFIKKNIFIKKKIKKIKKVKKVKSQKKKKTDKIKNSQKHNYKDIFGKYKKKSNLFSKINFTHRFDKNLKKMDFFKYKKEKIRTLPNEKDISKLNFFKKVNFSKSKSKSKKKIAIGIN